MNIIRKTLLKLARGVAREDVPAVPLPAPQIVRADRQVEKIKIGRSIGPGEYKVFPIEDILSYSKWEMAQEIGEKIPQEAQHWRLPSVCQAATGLCVRHGDPIPGIG